MEIKRDDYLDEIKAVMHNGLVKVITGIRRCVLLGRYPNT